MHFETVPAYDGDRRVADGAVAQVPLLQYESEEVAEPGAGQVRIRQQAIGVTFVDTYFRNGAFPLPTFPAVIGGEGAGVVDAVGAGVDSISVGDRVGSLLAPWAQHLGATVITPVASVERVGAAQALGLKHVVVAGTGRLAKEVAAAGAGADVVYDLVGRATFEEVVAVLRDGGTLDLIGTASGAPDLDATAPESRRIRVTRSSTSDHLPDRATLLQASEDLFRAWRDGVFGTRSIRTYPLSKVTQAHQALEAGISEAAIVLVPDKS
ncbi:hypothetical protein E0H75_36090 [Kribbella capetownensis]|uniref:Enoyl reductase (ER) domain-containing protein n=1 Tax=Kribbella capetownensis TaxID=1572659 RepID=A0A4R0JQQ4_9ACTN|nr:hypothetical protein E0H75_36090 [Kribbella capetownensis]